MPSIEALSPVFRLDPRGDRFCTNAQGQRNLAQLGGRLAGTPELVGLCTTEGVEPGCQPEAAPAGRVVALVRMLPMPQGRTMRDYASGCMATCVGIAVDQWRFGWPSVTVFVSPDGGPVLREAVELVIGRSSFADLAAGFENGPVDLRLMPALRNRLMSEIEREIARHPAARILPF